MFESNVVQSLTLTNPSGVVAIKLNCTGTSAAFNLVWASPPKSVGRFAVNDFSYLGELPAVDSGAANIWVFSNNVFSSSLCSGFLLNAR